MVIKVGLVGCGRIMPAHLHGYKALMEKNVGVRITALCARKIEDAKMFRKRGEGPAPRAPVGPVGDPLNVPHIYVQDFQEDVEVEIYDDYMKMLKEADVDAVEIYTSVFSHHPIVRACLEAGRHVLVEKPMAITVRAARLMVEAADKYDRVLGVAESLRYAPSTRMTKWTIDQGCIGDVQMIVSGGIGGYWSPNKIVGETPWRHRKVLAGGGPTIDFGVHRFDGLRYLCGEVNEVSGVVETFEKMRITKDETGIAIEKTECDVDDTFVVTVRFESGALGLCFISVAGHGESTQVPSVIYGTKGCIKGDTIVLDDGTRMGIEPLFEEKATRATKEEFFPYGIRSPMALETLEFLRAIQEGRDMETNGREGLRDLACSYAVIESSMGKSSVKVDEVESGRIRHYQEEIDRHYNLS